MNYKRQKNIDKKEYERWHKKKPCPLHYKFMRV